MAPFGSTAVPFIIISLGLIAVILSFLVVDRRKSLISLGMAGVIILTGLIQLGSQSITRYRWSRRMRDLQRDQRVNMDELRQKMQERQPGTEPDATKKK